MFVLVGDPEDLCTVYLRWLAEQRGHETLLLDEQRFGRDWRIVDGDAGPTIEVGGKAIASDWGAVVRFNPDAGLGSLPLDDAERGPYLLERRKAISYWLDTTPNPVVNRPNAGRCNASKALQMTKLANGGLDVPEWVVTNQLADAEDSAASWGGAIVKSVSGVRSQVRMFDRETVGARLSASSPVLIQRYVSGFDVRVHTIDGEGFGSRIDAEGVDYRWEPGEKHYRSIEVPLEVLDRCLRFAHQVGLVLAGFDFRVDDEGRWWCLEANPVPTFLPYEAATGDPIGSAIVRHCVEPPETELGTSPIAAFTGP